MIKQRNPELTVSRQCELLGLPTSTYYYEKKPMSDYNRYLVFRNFNICILRI